MVKDCVAKLSTFHVQSSVTVMPNSYESITVMLKYEMKDVLMMYSRANQLLDDILILEL